jgi:hypothetical protein
MRVRGRFTPTSSAMLAVACVVGIPLGCASGGSSPEDVNSESEALTATISGSVVDTAGRPLSGVTVHLDGTSQSVQTTGSSGTYSFTVSTPNATGSWSVQPTRTGCTFNPTVVNLNNINGNRTANFTGSGTACVGSAVTAKGTDPGPRPGPAGAGAPLAPQPIDPGNTTDQGNAGAACFPGQNAGLSQLAPAMLSLCEQAVIRFQEVDSIAAATVSTGLTGFIAAGTVESGTGIGPAYNANGCHVCHSQPGVLGAGVAPSSPQFPGVPNPQVQLATIDGARNSVPFFVTASGPIREARFTTDNGVHDLFSIAGRSDAPGCNATQPNFNAANAAGQLSFRIPISTFGDGLVESIPETALQANLATAQANTQFRTGGTFNTSGNDGTITRFGWKAQNKSITMFAGEAYNVEQGVSNILFPNERAGGLTGSLAGCFGFRPVPEDNTNFISDPNTEITANASDINSDAFNFALAIELSAPPTPNTSNIPTSQCAIGTFGSCANAATQGLNEFVNIGCANCHTQQLTTGNNAYDPALANVTIAPFSDFALHHMGSGLADGITQGNAGPDQFRTAPLWGVGQRLFFLHDGRTSDLGVAIEAHSSSGSDANTVITNFNNLSQANQQAILVFLRSL